MIRLGVVSSVTGLSRIEARRLQRQIDRRNARRKISANDNNPPPSPEPEPEPVRLMLGDCLQRLAEVADHSVDLVAADLPYGTTACEWDKIIPFDQMWAEFKRVLKPRGSVVLTSAGMFTAQLAVSNPDWFKYRLVWRKTRKTGFTHAGLKPLIEHEDINVFSPGTTIHKHLSSRQMTYNPQGLQALAEPPTHRHTGLGRTIRTSKVYGGKQYRTKPQTHTGYPTSVLEFGSVGGKGRHSTEKPVDLMAWIIRSYSNPGDVVLDPTMGRGTTGVAAIREGRQFIGVEQSPHWYAKASERIADELRPIAVAA